MRRTRMRTRAICFLGHATTTTKKKLKTRLCRRCCFILIRFQAFKYRPLFDSAITEITRQKSIGVIHRQANSTLLKGWLGSKLLAALNERQPLVHHYLLVYFRKQCSDLFFSVSFSSGKACKTFVCTNSLSRMLQELTMAHSTKKKRTPER